MLPEYLSREHIEPFKLSKEELQIHPNAIDLVNPSNGTSIQYENHCFLYLQDKTPDSFVIGPHLVDYMMGKNPDLGGVVRPDALLMAIDGTQATLTGMAEFKSGNGNGYDVKFDNKLKGFKKLLDIFRTNPGMLPEMLFYAVGEHFDSPAEIVVPPDEEIEITFLTPYRHGLLYHATAVPFPVTYLHTSLPGRAA